MLHFPSSSSAADTARAADVGRLHELLRDHVWAFSNCRVDVPGQPVAEVDWLFYNSVRGTFLVSEWKGYPSPVANVLDEGKPWVLADGSSVANPVEQVSRQAKAVRKALRCFIRERFFPGVDPLSVNPYQSVYSSQIGPETQMERLRYGRAHRTLDDLAVTIERITGPAPLLAASVEERLQLAEALCELFRCTVSSAVRRTLAPPPPSPASTARRVAAIHRELAALHLELATLLDASTDTQADPRAHAGRATTAPSHQTTLAPPPSAQSGPLDVPLKVLPQGPPKGPHALVTPIIRAHIERLVPASSASREDVRNALLASLRDERLRSSGLHVGLFGSLVGKHLAGGTAVKTLVPGGLRAWCTAQADGAGVRVEPDTADPSILRRAASTHHHEDVG